MAKRGKETLEQQAERIVAEHNIPQEQEAQAIAYVLEYLPGLLEDKQGAKDAKLPVKQYAEITIGNGLADGHHLDMEVKATSEDDEQEIIEVNQTAVKKALKALTTGGEDSVITRKLQMYYEKHAEYNELYFDGLLSHPLITIDKMNNRTLGCYTAGKDAMNIENHIKLNMNFVALNTDKRVLETLRHEMIHQWQDEILYKKSGVDTKEVRVPLTEKVADEVLAEETEKFKEQLANAKLAKKEGFEPELAISMLGLNEYVFINDWEVIEQKRRPKDWHTRDFKDYASVVGIPALGSKCTGNPAKMPEAKSYNRKFGCGCIASNGYPVTIWSTREVFATCDICGNKFKELHKNGAIIKVTQSHVEKPDEDAVANEMSEKFTHFMKFKTRDDRKVFMDELHYNGMEDLPMEEGVYQKHHNAYKDGYRYWLAYNGPTLAVEPEAAPTEDVKAPRNKRGPKAKNARVKSQDATATAVADRDYNNPADLIHLYQELGSLKAVAQYFSVSSASITYQKKKFNIDFGKGTYEQDGETKRI